MKESQASGIAMLMGLGEISLVFGAVPSNSINKDLKKWVKHYYDLEAHVLDDEDDVRQIFNHCDKKGSVDCVEVFLVGALARSTHYTLEKKRAEKRLLQYCDDQEIPVHDMRMSKRDMDKFEARVQSSAQTEMRSGGTATGRLSYGTSRTEAVKVELEKAVKSASAGLSGLGVSAASASEAFKRFGDTIGKSTSAFGRISESLKKRDTWKRAVDDVIDELWHSGSTPSATMHPDDLVTFRTELHLDAITTLTPDAEVSVYRGIEFEADSTLSRGTMTLCNEVMGVQTRELSIEPPVTAESLRSATLNAALKARADADSGKLVSGPANTFGINVHTSKSMPDGTIIGLDLHDPSKAVKMVNVDFAAAEARIQAGTTKAVADMIVEKINEGSIAEAIIGPHDEVMIRPTPAVGGISLDFKINDEDSEALKEWSEFVSAPPVPDGDTENTLRNAIRKATAGFFDED